MSQDSERPSSTTRASAPSHPVSGNGRGRRSHSALLRYIGKRLVIAVGLMFGMTLVTFTLTNLVPGDPVAAALGQRAADDPATVARFRAEYGLDKSLPQQYFAYLGRLVRLDLGTSWQTHNAVKDDLGKAVPATMEIAFGAIVCAAAIGITFGAWSAHRRGRLADQALRLVSLIGISVPTFWMAIVCFYVFYYRLGIAPGSGRLSPGVTPPPKVTGMYTVDSLLAGQWRSFVDASAHLALPTLVLTLYTIGLLTRFSRTSLLEVLDQDYIRAAKAKGLPGRTVFFKYVMRAAAIPILTVVGLAFGSLLSGTVLVESIFGWPGLGSYAYQAASKLDLLAVMGVGLFVGLVYLVINLVVDLAYGFIDPRVRVG
ncbi:MAG: ABC transporter permease [Propionibacteriaceae bacterium]|jgi:peptide/nickel transport system permease protein|nr:ABC transporter permease [Propionibacteriaceae bacterium]